MKLKRKIEYLETEGFKKEFKKLSKKFQTLIEDINVAKKNAIELFHIFSLDNQSIKLISGYCNKKFEIYKLRKFACKALKGRGINSGIRIIYAYSAENNQVIFIEIYFKAAQENENKTKIINFLETHLTFLGGNGAK